MEENDRLLMELAQRSKGLEPMLEAVFSFLKRKTDLYVEQSPGDRVGFPPGEARKIVLRCFNKFASAGGPAPDKKALEAIGTRLQADGGSAHRHIPNQPQQPAQMPLATQHKRDSTSQRLPTSTPPSALPTASPAALPATANLPHYNGAALETYSWSQTLTDVTISLPLSPPCSAKCLSVSIERNRLSAHRRDGASSSQVLQGDLPHDIDTSESLWNLDGNVLVHFFV
jgi:N-terminal conserved domain of Nudc./CS domain